MRYGDPLLSRCTLLNVSLTGPFDTEEDFNLELRKTYVRAYEGTSLDAERIDGMLGAHKHKIMFTHNDLHYTNILIKDGHISAIIDWTEAGWYPDYWEYMAAMRQGQMRRIDWNTILDRAIGRPHCEFPMIVKLREVLLW